MNEEPTIWIRGVNLVHDGRGYHGLELELPESLARHYVARGLAVVVEAPAAARPAEPPVEAQTDPVRSFMPSRRRNPKIDDVTSDGVLDAE